jgi:hypothetical protein
MNGLGELFLKAWALSQVASLIALWAGSRLAGRSQFLRLGQVAHEKKLRALDRMWPLTRIRPALERDDQLTCTIILTSLILLKSVASMLFGVIMVFWLPLASIVVPSIVAVHDPDNPSLQKRIRRVAALQVTSHALAAALGFAVVAIGPWAGSSILEAVGSNSGLLAVVSAASLGFAIAAGKAEAGGLMQLGL